MVQCEANEQFTWEAAKPLLACAYPYCDKSLRLRASASAPLAAYISRVS